MTRRTAEWLCRGVGAAAGHQVLFAIACDAGGAYPQGQWVGSIPSRRHEVSCCEGIDRGLWGLTMVNSWVNMWLTMESNQQSAAGWWLLGVASKYHLILVKSSYFYFVSIVGVQGIHGWTAVCYYMTCYVVGIAGRGWPEDWLITWLIDWQIHGLGVCTRQ